MGMSSCQDTLQDAWPLQSDLHASSSTRDRPAWKKSVHETKHLYDAGVVHQEAEYILLITSESPQPETVAIIKLETALCHKAPDSVKLHPPGLVADALRFLGTVRHRASVKNAQLRNF